MRHLSDFIMKDQAATHALAVDIIDLRAYKVLLNGMGTRLTLSVSVFPCDFDR